MQFIGINETSLTHRTILCQYYIPENLPSFILEFAKAIIKALKNQFSDSEIYNVLRIFDSKFLPQKESDIVNYGDDEIKF